MRTWLAALIPVAPAERETALFALAKASPEEAIVVREGTVGVASPGRDGGALLAWLALAHGPDTLRRLLASDAETFDAALLEVTGLDGAGVVAGHAAWRVANR